VIEPPVGFCAGQALERDVYGAWQVLLLVLLSRQNLDQLRLLMNQAAHLVAANLAWHALLLSN
jgi:hypothetical protein